MNGFTNNATLRSINGNKGCPGLFIKQAMRNPRRLLSHLTLLSALWSII